MQDIDKNARGINHQWARFLLGELIRQGIRTFVVSTGSRNTALMVALSDFQESEEEQLQILVHPDERGAAFFALGFGRATGKPAALVCASGTAVANYYPAVIEASMAHIPLIVVTADRPIEVRDALTDQVIDQRNIYSNYLRWSFDFPAPQSNLSPDYLLTAVGQAVYRATSNPCGPVHLNFCSRKPHLSAPENKSFYLSSPALEKWKSDTKPFTAYGASSKTISESTFNDVAQTLASAKRGLVVCSGLSPLGERNNITGLAQHLGWPILADITSSLRFGLDKTQLLPIVSHFELYLGQKEIAERLIPDLVLHFGGEPVNESVQQYLHSTKGSYILVNKHPFRQDPGQLVSLRLDTDPFAFAKSLLDYTPRCSSALLTPLTQAEQIAVKVLNQVQPACTSPSQWRVIAEIVQNIPSESGLFLGNSLPVREADRFAACSEKNLYVTANRGASGIDGNLATALGFAAGLGRPTTVFTGDLAFIHDLNSLLLLRKTKIPLTIVIPNNDGGGVFNFLPSITQLSCFEELFIAPHGLSFASAAKLFNLPYFRVERSSDFTPAYREALSLQKSSLVEVRIDRQQNVDEHKAIRELIRTEIAAAGILRDFSPGILRNLA